ncbi:MAG: hypothetical protein A3K30_04710 [Deltaproteobacteria bacterium RBG_13_51_10]|nr:MAG: hypothetical protein A3K30_04710 [Deltaproteobacteria bacterium RBG_13_51_10]
MTKQAGPVYVADTKRDLKSLQEALIKDNGKSLAVRTECLGTCGKVFRALMNDENTDGAIICSFATWYMKRFSETMQTIYAESSKPLLISSFMSVTIPEVSEAAKVVGKAGIPYLPSPERAAKAYSALVRYGRFKRSLKRTLSVSPYRDKDPLRVRGPSQPFLLTGPGNRSFLSKA